MGNLNTTEAQVQIQQPDPNVQTRDYIMRGLALNPIQRSLTGVRRIRYTRDQKEDAIRLLNMGFSYRQVARTISPNCSSGTPHRWRRAYLVEQERRRRIEQMRHRRQW